MLIYKITNLINDKIYIGKQKSNNENYYGSGVLIKRAIKKYGIEKFKKDIIEECFDYDTLNQREIYWINFYKSTEKNIGYNITQGGEFGDTLTNNPNREAIIEKMRAKAKLKIGEKNNFYGKHHSDKTKKIIGEKNTRYGKETSFYGKHHSLETIEKLKNVEQTEHKRKEISRKAKQRFENGFINPMSGKTGELCPHYIKIENDIQVKIINLYLKDKMTFREISTLLNIKYSKIREVINKNVDKSLYHNKWNRLNLKD
jgi:group I intron endonuclease